jgi:hypothetical protein
MQALTTEAIQIGAYGTPSVMVRGNQSDLVVSPSKFQAAKPQLFFGSDRFEQLAYLYKKPWYYEIMMDAPSDSGDVCGGEIDLTCINCLLID